MLECATIKPDDFQHERKTKIDILNSNCPVVLSNRHHVIPRCVHVYLICSRAYFMSFISLLDLFFSSNCTQLDAIYRYIQFPHTYYSCMQSTFRFSVSIHSWLISSILFTREIIFTFKYRTFTQTHTRHILCKTIASQQFAQTQAPSPQPPPWVRLHRECVSCTH